MPHRDGGKMKTYVLSIMIPLSLCLLPAAPRAEGCEQPDECLYGKAAERMERHFEPSYITALGGYDRSGNIRTDDLLYEAQIYLHLNWIDTCREESERKECDRNFYYRLFVPVRMQIRQYQTESQPVRTPSYSPGARFYFWWKPMMRSAEDFTYVSIGFHHYSNGQSGPHTVAGRINTIDGSFSTEYAEVSLYHQAKRFWGKVNFRRYLAGLTWEEDQTDYYETSLLELTGRQLLPFGRIDAQFTAGYKFGRKYVAPGKNASFTDNLQLTGELFRPVKNWHDVKLYLRWDRGYDYYNIYYRNKINRIQAGVIATYY